jgi:hypothetical protein
VLIRFGGEYTAGVHDLRDAVLAASTRPEVREAVARVYAQLQTGSTPGDPSATRRAAAAASTSTGIGST